MRRHLLVARPAEDRTFEAVEVMLGLVAGLGLGSLAGTPAGLLLGGIGGVLAGAFLGEVVEHLAGRAGTTMDATAPSAPR